MAEVLMCLQCYTARIRVHKGIVRCESKVRQSCDYMRREMENFQEHTDLRFSSRNPSTTRIMQEGFMNAIRNL